MKSGIMPETLTKFQATKSAFTEGASASRRKRVGQLNLLETWAMMQMTSMMKDAIKS